jgi:hypothetical protein
VKSTFNAQYSPVGDLLYNIQADAHDVLCGQLNVDFDIRRYLVVVVVPPHKVHYAQMQSSGLLLSNEAYILDLMGAQPIGPRQQRRLSLPAANLLTPQLLSEVVLGDTGRAQKWVTM